MISSLNQLSSCAVIFLFCVEREDGTTYFRAYISQRECLLCVQMCPWVIWQLQSPCLVVASFILLPSFICVDISQLGRVCPLCVSSSYTQVGLQMFGVHTMINRGHFILLMLQLPCLLWPPVMFRCILSSNCLTE